MPRKLTYIGATLALAYILLEAFSFVAYRAVEGRFLSFAEAQRERDEIISVGDATPGKDDDATEEAKPNDPAERRWGDSKQRAWGVKTEQTRAIGSFSHTLHPYLGHVLLPGSTYSNLDVEINQYGFADATDPLRENEGAFVVAITGGSFALQFYIREKERLAERLAAEPALTSRPIEVISLAVSGYKQPQQLLAVNYFLSLGGRIDILINIDGFNEVAWPARRAFAGYPLSWMGLTAGGRDPAEIALVGRIGVLRELRLQLAHTFSRMRLSATANLVWTLADLQLERAIVMRNQELEAGTESAELPYFRTGPKVKLDGSVLDFRLEIWRDSSLQLHALEQAGQLRYFHFLQPNQYAEGGKNLSARERRAATGNRLFAKTVPGAYARLQKTGRELAAAGVDFDDLTPIYDDIDETIYTDTCCHVNERGNELVAEEIVRFIRTRFY